MMMINTTMNKKSKKAKKKNCKVRVPVHFALRSFSKSGDTSFYNIMMVCVKLKTKNDFTENFYGKISKIDFTKKVLLN